MKKMIILISVLACYALAADYFSIYNAKGALVEKLESQRDSSVEISDVYKKNGPIYIYKKNDRYKNKNLNVRIDTTLFVKKESLKKNDFWIEIEKNQNFLLCFESSNYYSSSLKGESVNDSCVLFEGIPLVGSSYVSVEDIDGKELYKVNIAIGMKFIDLTRSKHRLGFYGNDYELKVNRIYGDSVLDMKNRIYPDPERIVSLNDKYLVDTYLATNCEIASVLSDEISINPKLTNKERNEISKSWAKRKRDVKGNKCSVNDTAANTLTLYQAIMYANYRSLKDGLKPYYKFEKTNRKSNVILAEGKYVISLLNFDKSDETNVMVTVDELSDGYRLPYYDEWMVFARAGDLNNRSIWGNAESVEKVLEYAWIGDKTSNLYASKPVGLLKPNKYGLYDVFGLTGEFVLFEKNNPFKNHYKTPSCLKGGNLKTRLEKSLYEAHVFPYWKSLNYGYSDFNFGASLGGVRLVRKLKK